MVKGRRRRSERGGRNRGGEADGPALPALGPALAGNCNSSSGSSLVVMIFHFFSELFSISRSCELVYQTGVNRAALISTNMQKDLLRMTRHMKKPPLEPHGNTDRHHDLMPPHRSQTIILKTQTIALPPTIQPTKHPTPNQSSADPVSQFVFYREYK
ncbi:unnamed protein product [Pleuronectes platessa]|uniref:Uncharacterized protein n=1 Tax=Pleuronectes platessa TaxID=8262 RepID=A0A9N7YUA7_PLEPL|nr:unnamed protein product [Pleuronectes platessa]